MSQQVDLAHVRRIQAVLDTLVSAPSVAHAMLVCEDANVALTLGLQLGLSLEQIVEQARDTLIEIEAQQ